MGFWLRHFGVCLQAERLLSDLFTLLLVAGIVAAFAGIVVEKRTRWVLLVIAATVSVLLVVEAAYFAVGRQFRSECLRADDALARTVSIYPGARLTGTKVWVDHNDGDEPLKNYLSITHLFPLAWNYGRDPEYVLPPGTTAHQVLAFFEPHFSGWHAPTAPGQLPDFYWRGAQAVEIDPHGPANQAFTGQQAVTSLHLFINGWSRPAKY